MGYNAFADATPESAGDKQAAARCTFDQDADFYLLTPHGDCYPDGGSPFGNYHLNHFVCTFKLSDYKDISSDMNSASRIMTHRFYRNFCEIFSEDNIARVHIASRDRREFTSNVSNAKLPYGEMQVFEFHIGGNLSNAMQDVVGFLHPDFVGMERFYDKDNVANEELSPIHVNNDADKYHMAIQSFCGNTLYRNWNTPLEDVFKEEENKSTIEYIYELAKSIRSGTVVQDAIVRYGVKEAVDVNRHHFLAGTRSWCVGFVEGAETPQFFVETAAFERNSSLSSSIGESLMGSRGDVNLLWEHLIKNFLGSTRISGTLPVPVAVPDRYEKVGGYSPFSLAAFKGFAVKKNWEFSSKDEALEGMAKNDFIKQIFDRHAGLRRHIL